GELVLAFGNLFRNLDRIGADRPETDGQLLGSVVGHSTLLGFGLIEMSKQKLYFGSDAILYRRIRGGWRLLRREARARGARRHISRARRAPRGDSQSRARGEERPRRLYRARRGGGSRRAGP